MTESSEERTLETFLYLTIRNVTNQPNFETVTGAHLKLNTNDAFMHSNQGNSMLDFLCLNNPTTYITLSTAYFELPNSP